MTHIVEDVDPVGVTFCRLRVEPEKLRRRLERRYGPEDVARALTEAGEWDRHGSTHVVVNTGEGDPLDSARRVTEAVRVAAPSVPASTSWPESSAPAPVSSGPGRAILICGPAAVGKSTVGFGLFMNRLGTGRAVAYLDLQQLGFLADLPDDAPSRPKIVAGCVGDLWQQYRSAGAQDLVLTGQVEQLDDVQRYRHALGATPLLVCRLQAGSRSLRERILARTRGGGPPLAGDALVGLSAGDAEAVLQHALAQQSHLQDLKLADIILDTEGKSPQVVTQLLRTSLDRGLAEPHSRSPEFCGLHAAHLWPPLINDARTSRRPTKRASLRQRAAVALVGASASTRCAVSSALIVEVSNHQPWSWSSSRRLECKPETS